MPRAKTFDPDIVLDRAVELFWRRGYDGASMALLLQFMGISRQSLYDTFGDKHSLFLRAVDRYRDNTRAMLEQTLASHDSGLDGIRAIFDGVMRNVIEHPEHRACLMATSALELGQHDEEVRERVAGHLQDVEARFCGALERAQAAGELGVDRDPRALARYLTNAIHGLGVLSRGGASTPMLRDSVDVTLSALA